MTTVKQDLITSAQAAIENAYAPYSNHPVGAALLADNGQIYSGCNVENAAYPLGACAEAGAISAMVNDGGRMIKQVVIVGPADEPCTPCGGCRQKIAEFATNETEVVMVKRSGEELMTLTMADLLPHAFGMANVAEVKK